jgi:uncharacterized protein (TIGR02145 family)
MKKSIYLYIYLSICLSVSLNGQSTNSQDAEKNESIQRNATYNLEEIKVRWKKAALENCTGVPCSFACGFSTVSDIDGNSYNTVLIGTQCWTKDNLKVTKYNDGTVIPDETANTAGWGGLATGARSDYTGEAYYIATYGYLYNWYAATDSRKICPTGWHVPTDGEWTSLIQFIVPSETVSATATGIQSPTAGTLMKSNSTLWAVATPPSPGNNTSGFSALPGGFRNNDGSFGGIRFDAFFWSATGSGSNAWIRFLQYYYSYVYRFTSTKSFGASVRCLRD